MRIVPAPSISGSEHREPKDLPSHLTLLESALPKPAFHNLFIIRTYADNSDVRETKALQAQEFNDNSFIINTYEPTPQVWETENL
jgi:hypothetical protein